MTRRRLSILAADSLLVLSLSLTTVPDCIAGAKAPAISNKRITIKIGGKFTLKIKNKGRKKVVWLSNNKKIATVSKKGLVKGKSTGSTKIKAKIGKKTLTCRVYVVKKSTADTTKPVNQTNNGTNIGEAHNNNNQTGKTPASTNKPSATTKPATTGKPSATRKPATTSTPAPTREPSATSTPATTREPSATSTPAPTQEPVTTNTPAPTKAPDTGNITDNPTEGDNKDDGWVPGWY